MDKNGISVLLLIGGLVLIINALMIVFLGESMRGYLGYAASYTDEDKSIYGFISLIVGASLIFLGLKAKKS